MGQMIDFSSAYADSVLAILDGHRPARKHHEAAYPCAPHGGNTISSGMAAGTICEADADGSDSPGADGAPAASSDDDDGGDPDPEPARPRSCNTPPPAIAPHPSGPKTRRNATATDGDSLALSPNPELWRLPQVLAHVPVSRSTWFAGVKAGRYPQPVRLSDRRVAWRAVDIRAFVAGL